MRERRKMKERWIQENTESYDEKNRKEKAVKGRVSDWVRTRKKKKEGKKLEKRYDRID